MGYDNHPVDFAAHVEWSQDRSGFGAASLLAFPKSAVNPSTAQQRSATGII